jgi:hypothetical protein
MAFCAKALWGVSLCETGRNDSNSIAFGDEAEYRKSNIKDTSTTWVLFCGEFAPMTSCV